MSELNLKNKETSKEWDEEYKLASELVCKEFLNGNTNAENIHIKTRIPRNIIARILSTQPLTTVAKEQSNIIIEKIFEDKLPTLRKIGGMSLLLMERGITERMANPEPLTVKEVVDVANIVTQMDKIARLEEGKPTDVTGTMKLDNKRVIEIAREVVNDPIRNPEASIETDNIDPIKEDNDSF